MDEQKNTETVETPKITPAILKARKNSTKLLQMMKKKAYFNEDNAETAIIRMLNSGMGRRGRRNLARNMGLNWKDYREMEDVLIGMSPGKLTPGAKRSIIERYTRLFLEDKISLKRCNTLVTSIKTNTPINYDEDCLDIYKNF